MATSAGADLHQMDTACTFPVLSLLMQHRLLFNVPALEKDSNSTSKSIAAFTLFRLNGKLFCSISVHSFLRGIRIKLL